MGTWCRVGLGLPDETFELSISSQLSTQPGFAAAFLCEMCSRLFAIFFAFCSFLSSNNKGQMEYRRFPFLGHGRRVS